MNRAARFRDGIHCRQAKFPRCRFLPILIAAGLPVLAAAQEKALRSPWDGKPVTRTDASYACPLIAHIAPDLVTDGFYGWTIRLTPSLIRCGRRLTANRVTE